MESIKQKLNKLLVLSRKGIDGEKVNAEILLQRLLKKYDLTITDIESEVRTKHIYPYSLKENKTILAQIIYHVVKDPTVWDVKGYRELCAETSEYEHIQINELREFHFDQFKKEKQKLLSDLTEAYVHKHSLYSDRKATAEDLENIDLEKLSRVIKMQENLDNVSFQKRIGIPNNTEIK